ACSSGLIEAMTAPARGQPVTITVGPSNVPAGTYYLWVDSHDTQAGDFSLTVSLTSGPTTETNCSDGVDNDNDGKTDCADSDCASASNCQTGTGDTCSGPITLTPDPFDGSFYVSGSTAGATNAAQSVYCSGATGPDRVYRLNLTKPSSVGIEVTPLSSGYRPIVYMRRNSCASTSGNDEVTCRAASTTSPYVSYIRHPNLPAGTYHVWVDGPSGSSGSFEIDGVFEDPLPFSNGTDTCTNAPTITMTSTGHSLRGSTAGMQHNYTPSDSTCGGSAADVVYVVHTLAGYSKFAAIVTSLTPGYVPAVELHATCGTSLGACNGAPNERESAGIATGLPGTQSYILYVIVDGRQGAGEFVLDVYSYN
ncbi:MAG: hypothetical protein ACK4N5_18195, partial [Myxococcales bacterium]